MTAICLGATAAPGTTIRTQVASVLSRSFWVSITNGGQTARSYAFHPPVESPDETLRRARAKMLQMREAAARRRRDSPDYADDEQSLAEQAVVAAALMPLQLKAMRTAGG